MSVVGCLRMIVIELSCWSADLVAMCIGGMVENNLRSYRPPEDALAAGKVLAQRFDFRTLGLKQSIIIGTGLAAALLIFLTWILAPVSRSRTLSASSHGGATLVSTSEVAGRWIGVFQGLVAIDITLFKNGSCSYSSGDFAGGQRSSGSWRLSGDRVTVQMSDGPLSFTYHNGSLVSDNGRSLSRQ